MTRASRNKYLNYLRQDAADLLAEGYIDQQAHDDYLESIEQLGGRDLFVAYCQTREGNELIEFADRMAARGQRKRHAAA